MTRQVEPSAASLTQTHARLISTLQVAAGPELTSATAKLLLRQAHAWSPTGARQLDGYLADHADAFVAAHPDMPLALLRLLKLFADNGFSDRVVLPGCVTCGRTDKLLKRRTPHGRSCERCMERIERRTCARCGTTGRIVGHRGDGGICRTCYRREPARHAPCTRCGEHSEITGRTPDGEPLCRGCTPRPKKPCVQCGQQRRIAAISPKGPVCRNCHVTPPRRCGGCGELRTISRRGNGADRPDLCQNCSRQTGDCSTCGRHRRGNRTPGGGFRCDSCYSATPRPCTLCERTLPVTAVWPLGPVCQRCYRTRLERPQPCADCGHTRILVCRNRSGDPICTRCGGSDLDFTCTQCGQEGPGYRNHTCHRCLLLGKITTLLGADKEGSQPHLAPLSAALAACDPGSVLTWMRSPQSLGYLADLAREGRDIGHDAVDRLPHNGRTLHIRAALVAAGVLPVRNEALAQLQLWVDRTMPTVNAEHRPIIRAYAEWHVVRRARQRAAHGPFRSGADLSNRQRILSAIVFLDWLADNGVTVAGLAQHHVDTYYAAGAPNPKALSTFLAWMVDRHLANDIRVPRKKDGLPHRFQEELDHTEQLRRCLTDADLPVEIRVVGALVRLYAIPVARIVELTADRFYRDDNHAYLVIDQNAVILPPSLATLIETLPAVSRTHANLRACIEYPDYLFPGRPPSRPRNPKALVRNLARRGLPTLAARNTAMMANVSDLEPIIISDLFGIATQTAHKWAQYAQANWAIYLAARHPRR